MTFTVTGRIVDAETGQPLPDVQYSFGVIQKSRNESYVEGSASPGTPTNAQGQFRLEGLDPGRYAVFASSSRFSLDPNETSKFYSDPVNFEVIDSDVTNLEIKAQRSLSLSGVVMIEGTADKNMPARLARLRITASVHPPRSADLNIIGGNGGVSTINADGSFQIGGLRPGRAQINVGAFTAADSTGFTISRIEHELAVQNRNFPLPEIEIQPGHDVSGVRVYVSYGTGVIRGQVKIEDGTLPSDSLILITVSREGSRPISQARVDSRGRFVIKGIPAGTYEVETQFISLSRPPPPGFPQPQKQTVTVTDDAETEVLFTLKLNPKN